MTQLWKLVSAICAFGEGADIRNIQVCKLDALNCVTFGGFTIAQDCVIAAAQGSIDVAFINAGGSEGLFCPYAIFDRSCKIVLINGQGAHCGRVDNCIGSVSCQRLGWNAQEHDQCHHQSQHG